MLSNNFLINNNKKKLDENQMNLLLSKFESNQMPPLWLNFACNELRIFGEFTMVTKLIGELPSDLKGLLKKVINRINGEFKKDIIYKVKHLFNS